MIIANCRSHILLAARKCARIFRVLRASGVFRGGHGAMPPLWPDYENF